MTATYLDLLNEASRLDTAALSARAKQDLIEYIQDISVKAARENFYVFMKLVAPERIRGTFRDGLHIRLICDRLQHLYENIVANADTGRKTQVFLSPESMKSELCTIIFPAWCIGRDPTWRVLAVAHGGNHARKHLGKPTKDLCRSEIYQRIFPKVIIDKESKSNEHWNTTLKGGYIAVGVGAGLPGKRANLTICLKNNNIVLTPDGEKQLGDLKTGDFILGRKGYQLVSNLVSCRHKLVYTINNAVDASPEHPFLVKRFGWKEAKDLEPGDKLGTATLWQKCVSQAAIRKCLCKHNKTAGGWGWEYLTE